VGGTRGTGDLPAMSREMWLRRKREGEDYVLIVGMRGEKERFGIELKEY